MSTPDHAGEKGLADFLALLNPEQWLRDPRANGAGVRLCVVDTGVERSLLEERLRQRGLSLNPLEGGIFVPGRAEPLPYTGRQSAPHGTTVADIVLSHAPQVTLFSADVFGPQGSSEVETVIHALHWAINVWKCHVVNLSLGVPESRLQPVQRRYQLLRAVEEAYFRDVVLLAAAHNDHPFTVSYPAAFAPPLISVDKGPFADPGEFDYAPNARVEFRAHALGQLGPFAREPATSWATAHLAGLAARLLSLHPGLKPFEIKTLLYWMGRSHAVSGGGES